MSPTISCSKMSASRSLNADEVFRLYKANSPFDGQQCFTDFLNQSLLAGRVLPSPWLAVVNVLDSLIIKSRLENPMMLYRATTDAMLRKHIVKSGLKYELIYPAYMSTATEESAVHKHFASPFRDQPAALLRIDCGPDTPALNMESDPSFGGFEQEMLLPRGSSFEIQSVTDVQDRHEMARMMSGFYADSYCCLRVYALKYKPELDNRSGKPGRAV